MQISVLHADTGLPRVLKRGITPKPDKAIAAGSFTADEIRKYDQVLLSEDTPGKDALTCTCKLRVP